MYWANRGFVCFVNILPAQPGRCLGNAPCPCSEGYLKPSFPTSNLCLLAADLCYLLVPGWSCYLQPCRHFRCCTCIKLSLFSHWHDWLVALPCGEWTLSSHQEVAAAFTWLPHIQLHVYRVGLKVKWEPLVRSHIDLQFSLLKSVASEGGMSTKTIIPIIFQGHWEAGFAGIEPCPTYLLILTFSYPEQAILSISSMLQALLILNPASVFRATSVSKLQFTPWALCLTTFREQVLH